MFIHKEKKPLAYSPLFLFELVLNIEEYPKFLPWCKAARIHKGKNILTSSAGNIIADLMVGTYGISETFTSHVTYDRDLLIIQTSNIGGPFDKMQSIWKFLPHEDNHCMIDFSVELVFKQQILQNLFAPFFENAIQKMVDAFETRAKTESQKE